jgi:biotin--protein ligase
VATTSKDLLWFLERESGSHVYPTFHSDGKFDPRSVTIQFLDGERAEGVYEQAPSAFVGLNEGKTVKILARYAGGGGEGGIAAVRCNADKGQVIFWAPSLDYPLIAEPALSTGRSTSTESIDLAEKKRQRLLQKTLEIFGLRLPSQQVNTVTHPLPQFLTAHRPMAVLRVLADLSSPLPATQLSVFKDANDTFNFHTLTEGMNVLDESRSGLRPSDDQSPKHIIVCHDGELPAHQQTPLFDIRTYYNALSVARAQEGCTDLEPWGMGEVLMYGEVVTSTQTMLDK